MINIIISCAGGSLKRFEALYFKKKSTLRNLVNVIGIDFKKNSIDRKYFDFVEKIPKTSDRNFIKKLRYIIIKYNVKFILIGADEEAIIISKNIEKFKNLNVKFFINNYATIKILSNKIATFKKLKNFKKILPVWNEAKNKKKLLDYINLYLKKYGIVVIKPSVSRGGRNIFIIKKEKSITKKYFREKSMGADYFKKNFLNRLEKHYPMMVMEKLKDPVFDLDIIASNGKLDYALLRKRLNPRDPNSGHKIIQRKDIKIIASKISSILKLNSINDCDFMIDRKNNLKLLEINPRPSGSFAIPNLVNIDLLDYVIKKSLFKNYKLKVKNITKDIIITKKYLNKLYAKKN